MNDVMRAVGYRRNLPITDPESLLDAEAPIPAPGPNDLLVRVEAVSVNPVDVKVRAGVDPGGELKVLGFDAAGVVTAVGDRVSRFTVGDEVYYAGSIGRPGSNAQYQVVDEHVVGHKPTSLSFAEAAALPLTTITAWEALFDRFALTEKSTGTLLVLGAAGGVGSVAVQLARTLTELTVVGTASRPESRQWVTELGAHQVVDHRNLVEAVRAVAPDGVDYLISPFTAGNIERYAEIVRPGGHIVAIDEPEGLDLLPLKAKSISWHWEFMFTRPLFLPTDPAQHELLEEVARLVDAGRVRTTMTSQLGPINAANLRRAHELVETSSTIGKLVLAGF
ncbi:zinc-binding alcohol dehydrogenase family protein [Micromonospora pisi]|uniref:Zinc-type alcohol dehydrogenase-like protein n=1 Tax=Micromonospora pisi TaxID=589240 RepID=A0A495JQJ7_9ACTN|nr:zinc-binding alcohol dehydrogenase family protein [Micromonospora pisi]RKR91111.1 zinc-binding alcohol dehydrogenase family protein [Micromonospora pisi]